MIQITIITLICCLLFGVPIAFAIGIAGTAGLYFGSTAPMFMVVKQFFEGINSFSYMAIPLFILAGAIMGKGGISKRIVNFASAILSWLRGGTAITTVGASMIFAAVSGSGAATISAIGGITVPEMLKKGYSRGFTAAMSAGAGSLGPIVPPSVDMIVFGCITGFSISRLFVGGIIPGFIIGLTLVSLSMITTPTFAGFSYFYIYAKKRNIDYGGKFRGKVVWAAFKDSIWALLMPIIIIGGVMGGAFTATEAGAVACVYGLIVSVFVYKSMSFKDLINVLRSASVNMAMVMMIIGFSSIFSYIFALEGMGQKIVDFMLSITTSPTGLFFLVIAFMVVIGCFMESLAALPIILPIIYPMFASLGVNLNQLGVVFALSTVLGGLTPPVGIYLFLSMNLTGAKMKETVLPHMLIVIGIMLLVIVLCILLPIPQFLPDLVFGAAT